VSRPWQLRHKLIFGLALVVASVALLLGGALLGLSSYFETMDTTQRKLDEMQIVVQLRDQIQKTGEVRVQEAGSTATQAEKVAILDEARKGRAILTVYESTLKDETLRRKLDPDGGRDELALIAKLEAAFFALENAVGAATGTGVTQDGSKPLVQDEAVQRALGDLKRLSTDLFLYLVADVRVSFDSSRANHRRSLYITGGATALSFLLVCTLLYYFRVWVFNPIKLLQAGVRRVHRGNFDQPIQLHSQDELQELAVEFNAMTTRLRDIYKDLARQVNERTRQLVRSERMVSVGFLAAGVAHEINNPLASIAFCSEALERRLQEVLGKAPGEADVIAKYLKMIQQEAFRCKQITQKLLDFSRSGGRREPTELSGLIEDVLQVAQHLPSARGKQLIFHPPGQITALCSGPDVKSVVLNMVVNALDSMDDIGTLTATLSTDGDTAEMTFTDSGCGMTADVLDNIFEPFFTRNRTGNGTGLGLSISHQIVDQHGGTIQAQSAGPGKGSTFVVRLPLRAIEVRPDTRDERPADTVAFPMNRAA
jgi:two-component system NtrC family sensor kinase